MDRRTFLHLSSAALLALPACKPAKETNYPLPLFELISDRSRGHLIFGEKQFEQGETIRKEVMIVGGGMAGLSAAYQLKNRDVVLCELSDKLGGNASAGEYKGGMFCQGAHYELTFPHYFGKEALGFFEELGILYFDKVKNEWNFHDRQFMIRPGVESQCLDGGEYRDDVLPETDATDELFNLLNPLVGELMLPTRLIPEHWQHLNQQTFTQFLSQNIDLGKKLKQALDYHMIDDFGGTADEVSALAGAYYYAGRNYETVEPEIFSPPQGNYYFAQKIMKKLPAESLLTKHLVKKINPMAKGFEVEVLDLEQGFIKKYEVEKLVYAGQKHALKYIYPQDYPLFSNTAYSPWIVMNFAMKQGLPQDGFWQNELLTGKRGFMGFVDSASQFGAKGRTLSAYFCLPPNERKTLETLEADPTPALKEAIGQIAKYYQILPEQFAEMVEKVFVKMIGHAMPVPTPGYLLNDPNQRRSNPNLVYAGTDVNRLPLLLEAVDSGLVAGRMLVAG
ncbi:NAD(P)-binding protein [Flammeovirgaceae bacterium SG7u.111]|nr:NAD(P)-binding protein [Flammeovirgaceae bacterium SG7u.132]WPO37097.1 NAD(P)-binding protein [Flammeovirgaceae bacterium SG7u.111]